MADTLRSNLVIPEILQNSIRGEFAGVEVMYNSGAAVIVPSLPQEARGGDVLKVPYFNTLGEFEDVAEGVALTPAQLAQTSETAAVARTGKAFSMSVWAQLAAAYADPYGEASRQLRIGFTRRAGKELITKAETSTLLKDVFNAGNPQKLDQDVLDDAYQMWGDEQGETALLVMHSDTLGFLRKLKDTTGRKILVKQGDVWYLDGTPILISDRLSKAGSPSAYKSLLIRKGAMTLWYNGEPIVDTDKNVLTDMNVAAVNCYFVAHLYTKMMGGTKPGVVVIRHN